MGVAKPPSATLLLHSHVGLYLYSASHLGSHTYVSSFLPVIELRRELNRPHSIYTTGLTKYALLMAPSLIAPSSLILHTCSGGTAGFAYSYLFALAGSLSLFTVLGEMASM